MAGRWIPGKVFSATLAIAISAPVFPAETMQSASPDATASIASRMLDWRPARSAADGFASLLDRHLGMTDGRDRPQAPCGFRSAA